MLSESIVKTVKDKLQRPQGEKEKGIYNKLENVLSKNEEFKINENMPNILDGIDNLI